MTKPEFLAVCHWKSPRTQPRCASNSPEFIRDVTQCALSTSSEQLRIEVLTLLNGVRLPTACSYHLFESTRAVTATSTIHAKALLRTAESE
ncbi:MAG: hypothetical protein ACKVRP_15780 [Bacteroidota bacterium]